jgi:CHAD domain-containing protein
MVVKTTETRTRSTTRKGTAAKATAAPAAQQPRPGQASPAQTSPAQTSPAQTSPAQAQPEPPRPAPARQIPIAGTRTRRSATAGEVVLAYLKVQNAALRSLEPRVRAGEPDSVHQMRVATRRFRATLRSFGKVVPRSQSDKAAAELKWLGGLLGQARDGEVIPAHLQASLEPVPVELLIGPIQARVQGYFAPRRASAREEVIEAFDSERYAALLAQLDRLASEPPMGPQAGAPARDVLPAAVHKAYRQANKRMNRAWHAPRGQARDAALHEARKSARRARYAAEATRPAAGQQARKFAKQMKKVQSVLGDHQDTIIARQAARDLGIGAHLAGENAFTYGLLHEFELHQADQLQAQARHVWKRASRARHRRWML